METIVSWHPKGPDSRVASTVEDEPNSALSEALAKVVAQLRQQQGMSMEHLAELADLHRTHIGLVERGERQLTISSAARIAEALGFPLSTLIRNAEHEGQIGRNRRTVDPEDIENEAILKRLAGLGAEWLTAAIESTYETLDVIDQQLIEEGSVPISQLVELANLSSMIGNLIGGALATASEGAYERNRPHAYPDLLPLQQGLPEIEIKTALEKNKPKGHLPKHGVYFTFRYVLGDREGNYVRGKEYRGQTAWIWEVRFGELTIDDFAVSNTPGDSGKTAVIKTDAFNGMTRVYHAPDLDPHTGRRASPAIRTREAPRVTSVVTTPPFQAGAATTAALEKDLRLVRARLFKQMGRNPSAQEIQEEIGGALDKRAIRAWMKIQPRSLPPAD